MIAKSSITSTVSLQGENIHEKIFSERGVTKKPVSGEKLPDEKKPDEKPVPVENPETKVPVGEPGKKEPEIKAQNEPGYHRQFIPVAGF